MRAAAAIALAICAFPAIAPAETLKFPANAVLSAQRTSDGDQARFAIGAFSEGAVEFATVDGARQSQVWRIREPSRSTSQIAALFRDQIAELGYEIMLDCADEACGGYDFRYALDLIEEPVMHVDLGDFRFISAMRPGTTDYLSLMISRSPTGIYIEYDIRVPARTVAIPVVETPPAPSRRGDAAGPAGTTTDVMAEGWIVLDDLTFATGSSQLPDADYASLERLAGYLMANPEARIALVGHTDAEGALAANIALSQRRAASVLDRLATRHGVPRDQMVAEGVGYLAPRWPNTSDAERRKNRRVEAVLTSTP